MSGKKVKVGLVSPGVAPKSKPMTQDRASVIQGATAWKTGTVTAKDFAARAMSAAAANAKAGNN